MKRVADTSHSFLFNKKLRPEGRINSQVAKQLAECGEAAFLLNRKLRGEKTGRIGMSKRETYEAECEKLLLPITEQYGVEIYDIEYVKEGSDYYLRAYIDKPDGVNIIDCENVSRALSDALDKADFIPDAYILEVSSPGLGRTLKKNRHLEKSIGEEIEIKLFKAVDKQKEFSGILESFDENTITITPDDSKEKISFNRADIALIRLAIDF
jgi:ribosome maturation factor RimP